MTLTDLIGGNDAAWMSHPDRPCAAPSDAALDIRYHADQWFPNGNSHHVTHAAKLCDGCAVATQCLTFALDNNLDEGVYGGLTPNQRATLRRNTQQPTGEVA